MHAASGSTSTNRQKVNQLAMSPAYALRVAGFMLSRYPSSSSSSVVRRWGGTGPKMAGAKDASWTLFRRHIDNKVPFCCRP
jgi:hypothetical protein